MEFLSQTQNSPDGERCTSENMKIICECVNTLLTDINQVQACLRKDEGETSQPHVVLQFLYHCVDAFPECYIVRPPVETEHSTSLSEQIKKHALARDFTQWIISRLVRILASPKCEVLHSKCITVITSVLKLIRAKDLLFYSKMIKEFIGLYADILYLCEQYFASDESETFFAETIYCSRFQTEIDNDACPYPMPSQLIAMEDYSNCQHVLTATNSLLMENVEYIQQFVAEIKMTLSESVVRSILLADIKLIPGSFEFLSCLMKTFTSLLDSCFDQYAVIATSVMEFLVTENSTDEKLLKAFQTSLEILLDRVDSGDSIHPMFVKKLVASLIQVLNVENTRLQVCLPNIIKCCCEQKDHQCPILTYCRILLDMLLKMTTDITTRHPSLIPGETSTMLVNLCLNQVRKKKLSKVAQDCFITLVMQDKHEKSSATCSPDLQNHMKDLSNLIQHADNNHIVCWELVRALNVYLRILVSCHQSLVVQEQLKVIDIERITEHILNLYLTQVFFTNLDVTRRTRIINETLKYVINYFKLHCGGELSEERPHIIGKCLEIASVPWLCSIDPPWFDFSPVEYQQAKLIKLFNAIKPCLGSRVIGKCLKVLSFIGKKVECQTWLIHIMRSTLGDSDPSIQRTALKHFAQFSHSLGTNCHSLLGDETLTIVHSATVELQTDVARILGDLICMVSGKTVMKLERGKVKLVCHACAQGRSGESDISELAELFKPFFQMMRLKSSTVCKKYILLAFQNLLNHLDESHMTSSSLVSIWTLFMDSLQDPQFEIRFIFSDSLGRFLKAFDDVTIHQLAIDKISNTFAKATEINDIGVMETVVLTMGDVGKASCGDLVSVMLVSLFICFITQSKLAAAIAYEQIHEIAKSKKITCQQLFIDHKNQLCDISVKNFRKLLEANKGIHSVTEKFFDIGKLFEFPDVKAFLLATATEMLPKIVQLRSPQASVMLRLIAKYSQQNRREMMFYNFKYIFSYLVRHVCDEAELERCLRYLQEETDVELSSLLLSECQSVFNQLMLYLSVNREQVFQGFSILACNDASYTGPTEFYSDADVAMFLHHRLLGVLAFFNSVLTNSPNYEKRIALKSILCLLKIVGRKYLTPVRLKVMAILKLTLRYKDDFPDLCCAAWDGFVRNIDVECLGPLLGQIVATLLPLLDVCGEKVANILSFLVIENRASLSPFFKDIYFIPDNPVLKKIKSIIESSHVVITTTKDFKSEMGCLVKGIAGENEDVQKFALMKLCNLLKTNSSYLVDILTMADTMDPVIKQIIDVLLKSCKEKSTDTYRMVGKCLGQLGAIDPGRIENLSNSLSDDVVLNTDIHDIHFAYDIINELCRSFLAASNTRAQDCAAYALQEILQYYGCTNQPSKDSAGYQLWQKFSSSTRELIYPHLHSKYVNSTAYNWSKHSAPIYGSVKGSCYRDWVCNWTNYLIHYLGNTDSARVFKPCMSIIKHDIRIALFMMPFVVLNTILSVSDHSVHTEIEAILQDEKEAKSSPEYVSCTQTLFSVLDFLHLWSITSSSKDPTSQSRKANSDAVDAFLDSIPKDTLAKCSFKCNALSRSLMYYEQFIEANKHDGIEDHLAFLQKIYYTLDEPDGIAGIAATRNKTTSLREQIIEHESSGNLRDAVTCYERAIQQEPDEVSHHKGVLKCLIGLGELNIALMDVAGVMNKRKEWNSELNQYQAEISWRLGQWDILRTSTTKDSDQIKWSISLGKLLLSLKERNVEEFGVTLSSIRSNQTQSVMNATLESGGYQRAYESIVCLHMLEDVEACSDILFSSNTLNEERSRKMVSLWDQRLDILESSFKSREPVLNLRRILISLLQQKDEMQPDLDNCWLRTAKIARKDGLFQTAHSSLLNVNDNNQVDILIEKATRFACLKDLHKALLSLQKDSISLVQCYNGEKKKYYSGKISLLKAKWMEQTEYYEPEPVLTQYKDAVEKFPSWEKGHFCLAKYYEKLMNAWDEKENVDGKKTRKNDLIKFVIKHYGMSLQFGSKYIYQSMPRLLTLWLDFGITAQQVFDGNESKSSAEVNYFKEKINRLNEDITKYSKVLPEYQFLTAFSQLVSRICHPHYGVWEILKVIICKILCSYKQQAIWNLVAVSKSSFPKRSERCRLIFQEASTRDPSLKLFIAHALDLTDQLLDVCNRRVGKESKLSMLKDFPVLTKMLQGKSSFSNIMVPLQETLTVKLPTGLDPRQHYTPFSDNLPMIIGMEDTIDVLNSLQKPKKIVVRASDGSAYMLMCKPKDDLRKDQRLMEFNSLVNKLLINDPDCRRRQLHIRTYAVIPLNEECGLLQWVPHTYGLRYILNKIYKEKGILMKVQELKQVYDSMKNVSVRQKVDIYLKRIVPRFPPVFHLWFLNSFPSPSKWYMARLAYCRTTAVICMVGYILGLGDRHGENILFDAMSGDCVHVDFNCLFNKGETFDCPERVPFRLTHNMINAMGPLGYEGMFRKSCEYTMKLMRSQKDSLLSVLNTFLYDPLVEWKKESRKRGSGETTNEMALKILKKVEHRLEGYINSTMIHLPLSIEGQVHQLIKEATDNENLAQMYIGWAAYM